MSKTVKEIIWILNPIWMPCMICKTKQSTKEVILNEAAHFTLCDSCAAMTEAEIKIKLRLKQSYLERRCNNGRL